LDYICHSCYFVAAWIDQWLHYWRIHSHPAGHRHSRGIDSGYSGTKTIVDIEILETYKGVVQLSGFVNSQKAVDKASEIVGSVKWVKSVKNALIVK